MPVEQKTSVLLINWLPKPNLSLQTSFLLVLPPRSMIFGATCIKPQEVNSVVLIIKRPTLRSPHHQTLFIAGKIILSEVLKVIRSMWIKIVQSNVRFIGNKNKMVLIKLIKLHRVWSQKLIYNITEGKTLSPVKHYLPDDLPSCKSFL